MLQVKKLASALARQTGEEKGDATRHLYQKVAVLLYKGKAALRLNILPDLWSYGASFQHSRTNIINCDLYYYLNI